MPPAASQDTFIDELESGARNWERKLDGDAGSVCLLSGPKELPIVLSGLLIITIVQYTAIDPILVIRIKPPKLLFAGPPLVGFGLGGLCFLSCMKQKSPVSTLESLGVAWAMKALL